MSEPQSAISSPFPTGACLEHQHFEPALRAAVEQARRAIEPTLASHKTEAQQLVATNPIYARELGALDWQSIEWKRYRFSYDTLAGLAAAHTGRFRILDVGAGVGIVSRLVATLNADVTALDNYSFFGSRASSISSSLQQEGIRVVTADLSMLDGGLPFVTGTFDVVLLLAVIEHLPHSPRSLLSELHRVLRPGGCLLLDTPNVGALIKRLRMLLKGKGPFFPIEDFYNSTAPWTGHFREFNARELRFMINASGFSVVELRHFSVADFRRAPLRFTLLQGVLPTIVSAWRDSIWIFARKDSTR